MEKDSSVLFVHHMDVTAPFKSTVPYYLTSEIAEERTVHVVCRRRSSKRTERDVPQDLVVHDIDTGEIPVVSGFLFMVLSTLYSLVLGAANRFDVVYTFQYTLIQGWGASRAAGGELVVGFQSVPVRQNQDLVRSQGGQFDLRDVAIAAVYTPYARLVRTLLERATTIFLTEGIRDVTESVYDVDLSDAHVIGMGIDLEKFTVEEVRTDGARADAPTITYVGTISRIRGIDTLIEAVAEIERDVEVVLAGTGSEKELSSLKAKASDLGVEDRIDWLGLVPHEEIPRILAESDIAVSPLSDVESYRISFPAKLLEYMASECLVVATDIPAHRRVIEDGENGFLYEPGPAELANALTTCIENEERHRAMQRNARETAERYSWDAIAAEHEAAMFG